MLILRLLRSILPSWESGDNTETQNEVIHCLFEFLGEILVLCSSPFSYSHKKKKKVKVHTSLLASSSSTIAEEILVLLRRLHPLPAWNKIINKFIGTNLQSVPQLVIHSEKMGQTGSDIAKEEQVTGNT